MITGILLAAGRAERFGGNKLRAHLPDSRTVAGAAAGNMVAALPRVLAVVRPDSEALEELLRTAGCEIVVCDDADEGMGNSLACGVRATRESDGWIVALADMPIIRPETIQRLAARLTDGAAIVAPTYNGHRGHPVGFAARFANDLATLTGDEGARQILQAHRDDLRLIETDDPGVLHDIDEPRDFPDPSG